MSVAKTLADVGEDLTLECGSVVRAASPGLFAGRNRRGCAVVGRRYSDRPAIPRGFGKWFADPKQRQEIAVAAAERYCGQLLPLIRRVAFTSPKVICAVCGISSDEFRAMISLRDIAAILAKVLAAMQSDVLPRRCKVFSQFGALRRHSAKAISRRIPSPDPQQLSSLARLALLAVRRNCPRVSRSGDPRQLRGDSVFMWYLQARVTLPPVGRTAGSVARDEYDASRVRGLLSRFLLLASGPGKLVAWEDT